LIKKCGKWGFRVLACAETGARTPLGMRQYIYKYHSYLIIIYWMATAWQIVMIRLLFLVWTYACV
jgi:hypothetical protein